MSERRTPGSEEAIDFDDAEATTSPRDVYAESERSEFDDSVVTFRKIPIPQHDVVREHEMSNFSEDREREEYEVVSSAYSIERRDEDEAMPVWASEILKIVSSMAQAPDRDRSRDNATHFNSFKNQNRHRVNFAATNQRNGSPDLDSNTDQNTNRQSSQLFNRQEERNYNPRLNKKQYNDRQNPPTYSRLNYERLYPNDRSISNDSFEHRKTTESFYPEYERQYVNRGTYGFRTNYGRSHSQERRDDDMNRRGDWEREGDFQRDINQFHDGNHFYREGDWHSSPYPAAYGRHRRVNNYRGLVDSIPSFSGRENWLIWINRFEVVADRQGLDEEEKLDLLIPKLTGEAAELVFSQLPRAALWDYQWLLREINNRFRVIETAKTFAAKFSQRNQRENETAEAYAAELKRLYDKAHQGRDGQTRREDLLRRFLDGLRDSEVRWQVEYVKEPGDIDEAVYQVVSFIQLRGRFGSRPYGDRKAHNHVRRATQGQEEHVFEDCQDTQSLHPGYDMARRATINSYNDSLIENETKVSSQNAEGEKLSDTAVILQKLVQSVDSLVTELKQPGQQRSSFQSAATGAHGKKCYKCGAAGHFQRNCPSATQYQSSQRVNWHQENHRGACWSWNQQSDNRQRTHEDGQRKPRNQSPRAMGNSPLNLGGPISLVGERSQM